VKKRQKNSSYGPRHHRLGEGGRGSGRAHRRGGVIQPTAKDSKLKKTVSHLKKKCRRRLQQRYKTLAGTSDRDQLRDKTGGAKCRMMRLACGLERNKNWTAVEDWGPGTAGEPN